MQTIYTLERLVDSTTPRRGLSLAGGSQLAQPRIHRRRLVPFSPPWSALLPRPPCAPTPLGAPRWSDFGRTSGQETGHSLSPGGLL